MSESSPTSTGVRPIRRFFAAAPAATLLLAVLVAAAASPVSARSAMALGVSQYSGNRDIARVHAFAAAVGEYPASWTMWSTWGDPNLKSFPTQIANDLQAIGVTPMVWWEPYSGDRTSCAYARHRDIARGRYDRYIKSWARAAKSTVQTVLVRYTHEINGKYFPWGIGNCGNTLDAFKDGWRHIVRLFRKVGATNVKFVWTVSRASCRPKPCNPFKPYYPGNKWVNYVGFSNFNWGNTNGRTWTSMLDGIAGTVKWFGSFTRKPVIVAELATSDIGGDKPAWIRTGYRAVYDRFPRIKGITYLNVDLTGVGHPDWSLNDPSALLAYRDIVNLIRFQGGY